MSRLTSFIHVIAAFLSGLHIARSQKIVDRKAEMIPAEAAAVCEVPATMSKPPASAEPVHQRAEIRPAKLARFRSKKGNWMTAELIGTFTDNHRKVFFLRRPQANAPCFARRQVIPMQ